MRREAEAGGPLLLGHRGHRLGRLWRRRRSAPAARPEPAALGEIENTRAAFDRAMAAGCDGLEIDLHRTADGEIVIHHDAEFRIPGAPRRPGRRIAEVRLEELRRELPELMTLAEFLRRYGARAWLDLEIKGEGVEAELTRLLQTMPPRRGCVVSCFRPEVLERLAELDIEAPLCLNLKRPVSLKRLRTLPVTWVAPHERLATRWYVDRLHRAGYRVLVWTVNRPRKLKMLLRARVAAVVSDDPEWLVRRAGPTTGGWRK